MRHITLLIVLTMIPGLPQLAQAHGRATQTVSCHMNVNRPGYHCHATPPTHEAAPKPSSEPPSQTHQPKPIAQKRLQAQRLQNLHLNAPANRNPN